MMDTEQTPPSGPHGATSARASLLSPIDRYAEVLFGLFMAVTFTGTLSVTTAGQHGVQAMMLAALGCNTAWGFVDGVMYVLRNVVARGQRGDFVRRVHATPELSPQAHRLIADEVRPTLGELSPAQLAALESWLRTQPSPKRAHVTRDDLRAAVGIFLLVFGSTFPVVLPFLFVDHDLRLAIRLSWLIAIAMLFGCGYAWGRYAGGWPWRAGLLMVAAGLVIMGVVIALGG